MNVAYEIALKMPRYSINFDMPVPDNIKKNYKESIITDLNLIIIYARLLPASMDDNIKVEDWLIQRLKTDKKEELISVQQKAYNLLSKFAKNNNISLPQDKNQWYTVCNNCLEEKVQK